MRPTSTSWSCLALKVDNLGPRPEYKLEGIRRMVHGVLYGDSGMAPGRRGRSTRLPVSWWCGCIARNEGRARENAPRRTCRDGVGVLDRRKEERILYVTPGYRLIALNAKTGNRITSFGENGVVDLKLNDDQNIDLETGEIGLESAPVVAKDVIIIGAAFKKQRDTQIRGTTIRATCADSTSNRQAPLDFPHHPAQRRVRVRHLGERLGRVHRQRRGLDSNVRR